MPLKLGSLFWYFQQAMDDPWTQLIEKGFDAFHITSFHNSGWFENPKQTSFLFLFQIFGNKNIKQKQQMIPKMPGYNVSVFLFSMTSLISHKKSFHFLLRSWIGTSSPRWRKCSAIQKVYQMLAHGYGSGLVSCGNG